MIMITRGHAYVMYENIFSLHLLDNCTSLQVHGKLSFYLILILYITCKRKS